MKYNVDGQLLNHVGHTPDALLFTKEEQGMMKLVEVPFVFEGIVFAIDSTNEIW